jgi:hypothetical protein
LVLFAFGLRLSSDSIRIADLIHAYLELKGTDAGWYWSRAFARNEQEIGQALVYLVDAVMVEGLARVYRRLLDRRLAQIQITP